MGPNHLVKPVFDIHHNLTQNWGLKSQTTSTRHANNQDAGGKNFPCFNTGFPHPLLLLPRARLYYNGIFVAGSLLFFISPRLKRESNNQQYSHPQWVPFNSPPQTTKSMTFQRTTRKPEAIPTVNTHNHQAEARVPVQAATRQTYIQIIS